MRSFERFVLKYVPDAMFLLSTKSRPNQHFFWMAFGFFGGIEIILNFFETFFSTFNPFFCFYRFFPISLILFDFFPFYFFTYIALEKYLTFFMFLLICFAFYSTGFGFIWFYPFRSSSIHTILCDFIKFYLTFRLFPLFFPQNIKISKNSELKFND